MILWAGQNGGIYAFEVGATGAAIGSGCSTSSGAVPVLSVSDPVLGGTMTVRVNGAPLISIGTLRIGRGQVPTSPTVSGKVARPPFCPIYVARPTVQQLPSPDVSGVTTTLTVPNEPGLVGHTFVLQAVFVSASGISTSNGWSATIGP